MDQVFKHVPRLLSFWFIYLHFCLTIDPRNEASRGQLSEGKSKQPVSPSLSRRNQFSIVVLFYPTTQFQDLLKEEGYESYWACSKTKKGYAGTAAFVKKNGSSPLPSSGGGGGKQTTLHSFIKKGARGGGEGKGTEEAAAAKEGDGILRVLGVTYGIGNGDKNDEGRVITIECEEMYIVNVYVPNSGMKLERLQYRLGEVSLEKNGSILHTTTPHLLSVCLSLFWPHLHSGTQSSRNIFWSWRQRNQSSWQETWMSLTWIKTFITWALNISPKCQVRGKGRRYEGNLFVVADDVCMYTYYRLYPTRTGSTDSMVTQWMGWRL